MGSLRPHSLPPSFCKAQPCSQVIPSDVKAARERCSKTSIYYQVLFRYWSNANVSLQVCALGYGIETGRIECVDKSERQTNADKTLAVFDMQSPIAEPFTVSRRPTPSASDFSSTLFRLSLKGRRTDSSLSTKSPTWGSARRRGDTQPPPHRPAPQNYPQPQRRKKRLRKQQRGKSKCGRTERIVQSSQRQRPPQHPRRRLPHGFTPRKLSCPVRKKC